VLASRASAREESKPLDHRCAKGSAAAGEASVAPSQTHPRARGVTRSPRGKARRRRSADEGAKPTPLSTRSSEATHSRGRPAGAPSATGPVSTSARDKATSASDDDDRMLRLPCAQRAS
jgi:hypothetical protein